MIEGFFLGLSTGTFCMMTCIPIALPFLFSAKQDAKSNATFVIMYFLGRLSGYVLTGALLGAAGAFALSYLDPQYIHFTEGILYTAVGLLMIISGVMYEFPQWKFCKTGRKIYQPEKSGLIVGFLSGIHLCPPFFVAASRVFGNTGALSGALYFLAFYLGTSVFLLPLFGAHLINKNLETVRTVSRMTLIVLGIYFFLSQGFLNLL